MSLRKLASLVLALSLALVSLLPCLPVLAVTEYPVSNITFDNGSTQGLYATGNAKSRLVSDSTHSGSYALEIYNRTELWNAAEWNMTGRMLPGNTYRLSAWVYQNTGESRRLQFSVKYIDDDGDHYDYAVGQEIKSGEWTYILGKFTVPDCLSIYPYIEQTSSLEAFRVDDIVITQTGGYLPDTSIEEELSSLKEVFSSSELGVTVGVSVGEAFLSDTTGNQAALVTKHFDAIAPENQLKASYLLDYDSSVAGLPETNEAPVLNFSAAVPLMDFAAENGLTVKAQCLVWHQMVPEWFFHKDYDEAKPLVSRDVMLARLESYIKDVLTWCDTEYPGVADTWIVVNEAVSDDSSPTVRDDNFYKTIGEDYIAKAFEFADKYRPEGVTYLYNDYNIEAYDYKMDFVLDYLESHDVIENGWVDGIGFQTHVQMGWPGVDEIKRNCAAVAAKGLSAQVTELDISLGQSEVESYGTLRMAYNMQRERYAAVIGAFLSAKSDGLSLTNITWWGLTDAYTWLSDLHGEKEYPLLFDSGNKAKPAFYGVLDAVEIAVNGGPEPEKEPENLIPQGAATGDNGHQNDLVSSNAVDRDENSRWAGVTTHGNADDKLSTDYLWVDFGAEVTFNKVCMKWEACYGKDYTVEIKDENPTENEGWTVVATVTDNNGSGWRNVLLEEAVTARYLRVNITRKDNSWGVSIYELQAYYIPPVETDNLAYGKQTGDNGHQGNLESKYAVDGFTDRDNEGNESRWAGVTTHENANPNLSTDYLWVDFGEEVTFNDVLIKWEACFGRAYTLETRNTESEEWTVISSEKNNNSGWRETVFEEPITARYLRVNISEKANSWGVSIHEIEVYFDESLTEEEKRVYIGEDTEDLPQDIFLPKPGDVTGDNEISADDLTVLARHVGAIEVLTDADVLALADVNGDKTVNADDLTKLARIVGKIE